MPIQLGVANLKYLLDLQPPKQLITWLNGFNADGEWDAERIVLPKKTEKSKVSNKKQSQSTTKEDNQQSTSKPARKKARTQS